MSRLGSVAPSVADSELVEDGEERTVSAADTRKRESLNHKYDRFDKVDEYEFERADYFKSERFEKDKKDFEEGRQEWIADQVSNARRVVCTVTCDGVTLKLTLGQKLLLKQFLSSVVEPFLKAFNKKRPEAPAVDPSGLASVLLDGKPVDPTWRTTDLLVKDVHAVTLLLPEA